MNELLQLHPPTALGFSATWIKSKEENEMQLNHQFRQTCVTLINT